MMLAGWEDAQGGWNMQQNSEETVVEVDGSGRRE